MADRSTQALATGINGFLSVLLVLLVLAGLSFVIWILVLGPAWGPESGLSISVPVSINLDPEVVSVTGPDVDDPPVALSHSHTELRIQPVNAWQRWLYGGVGLVVVVIGIYLVRLLQGVVGSIGRREPFAAANASRIRRGGILTVGLTVAATISKYLVGYAVIADLQTTGVELRPWFDPQVEFLIFGLLCILFGTLFQRGHDLEEDTSLTI